MRVGDLIEAGLLAGVEAGVRFGTNAGTVLQAIVETATEGGSVDERLAKMGIELSVEDRLFVQAILAALTMADQITGLLTAVRK